MDALTRAHTRLLSLTNPVTAAEFGEMFAPTDVAGTDAWARRTLAKLAEMGLAEKVDLSMKRQHWRGIRPEGSVAADLPEPEPEPILFGGEELAESFVALGDAFVALGETAAQAAPYVFSRDPHVGELDAAEAHRAHIDQLTQQTAALDNFERQLQHGLSRQVRRQLERRADKIGKSRVNQTAENDPRYGKGRRRNVLAEALAAEGF